MNWEELKQKYSNSIIELEVKDISLRNRTILFNIENNSAILPVYNISNNRELSEKLFSIIKIGEIVSVFVVGFEDREQTILLSTKAFRNYLDDVLPFRKCETIIKENYNRRYNNPFHQENRNILDRLRGDLSSNELTFLYELIQNAVDHPNPNFNNISIKFEIMGNYLLLKHNGSLFTENNFNSLCGILFGEQENEHNTQRIGYKGIGFKSVFRFTTNAYIRSGNFSFSFDKEKSGPDMPWEVLPRFEFEKDKIDTIPQFDFFNVPVAFAFEIANESLKLEVIKYLRHLSANPYLLIFLDNLIKLEIKLPEDSIVIEKEVERRGNYDLLTIITNKESPSTWVSICKAFDIDDEEVIRELNDENNTAIPAKMRLFRTPKIRIAYPMKKKEDLINFFTYLPLSNTKYDLPYIINADFIPNLDRTDFIQNLKYNTAILKFTSDTLLDFSQQLINDNNNKSYSIFLDIIPGFVSSKVTALKIIAENYRNKAKELKLPNRQGVLKNIDDAVIDTTGIFSIVDESFINEIEDFECKFILSPNINDDDHKLSNGLGVSLFDDSDLISLLKLQSFQENYIYDPVSLIIFLFRTRHIYSSKKIHNILRTKVPPIRLNDEHFCLNMLTFNVPNVFKETFTRLELFLPYPEILEYSLKPSRTNIKSLLDNLTVNEFDAKSAVDHISNNIKMINSKLVLSEDDDEAKKSIKTSQLCDIWHFLFLNKNLVTAGFSDLLIECTNGQRHHLKNAYLMKEDTKKEDYSFLYEGYGNKEMNVVNVDSYTSSGKIPKSEFVKFLKHITDIEITESKLFRQTLHQLSSDKFKSIGESEPSNVLRAFISIFNFYSKDGSFDISRNSISSFPIICRSGVMDTAGNLYFDASFAPYSDGTSVYADKLFENIEGINFVSDKYLEYIEEKQKKDLFKFLSKLGVSPGIKVLEGNTEKRFIDSALPNISSRIRCTDNFFYVHNFQKLSAKYENLVVFWDNLHTVSELELLTKKLSEYKLTRKSESPLTLYLNDTHHHFFPMLNGECTNVNGIYAKDLWKFLSNIKYSPPPCISNYPSIVEILKLKNTLDNCDLIEVLSTVESFSDDDYEVIMLDHFSSADFTPEELSKIIDSVKFKCNDGLFRLISECVYLDEDLNNTSLNVFSKSNELFQISVFNFEFDTSFKSDLIGLGIRCLSRENIKVRFDPEPESDDNIAQYLIQLIVDFFDNRSEPFDTSEYDKMNFIQCSNLTLTFENYEKFSEPVLFHADTLKQDVYYTDSITLLDFICEKSKISNADKFKIRNELNKKSKIQKEEKESNYRSPQEGNSNEFTEEEIAVLIGIIGGEFTEELSFQIEANFSASLRGILELDRKGYAPQNVDSVRDSNVKPFINAEGHIRKIIFRSSVKGLLYLDPFSWKILDDKEVELWIYIGNNRFEIICAKIDLLNMPYNPYTLIRVDNVTKDIHLIDSLILDAPINSTKILFVTNQEMAEKFNTDIFKNENKIVSINKPGDESYL